MNKLIYPVILITILLYFKLKKEKDPNPELIPDQFEKSNNLIHIESFYRKLMIFKGEEYRKKLNQKCRYLYKNVISDSECNYWKNLISKYHLSDTNDTYGNDPEDLINNNNKGFSYALDQIYVNKLIRLYQNDVNKIKEVNELKEADTKFNSIIKKMKKYTENCYKKKLRLHSCNIICGNSKFQIPCHIDGLFSLQYTDSLKRKMIIHPTKILNSDGSSYYFADTEPKYFDPVRNRITSTNLDDYDWVIPGGVELPDPPGFTGGQNDKFHTISCILYLSSQGEDFENGELLLGLDDILKPKKGNVAIFTGGPENVHKVIPVSTGKRTTFLFWFSELDGPYLRNRIFANEKI